MCTLWRIHHITYQHHTFALYVLYIGRSISVLCILYNFIACTCCSASSAGKEAALEPRSDGATGTQRKGVAPSCVLVLLVWFAIFELYKLSKLWMSQRCQYKVFNRCAFVSVHLRVERRLESARHTIPARDVMQSDPCNFANENRSKHANFPF